MRQEHTTSPFPCQGLCVVGALSSPEWPRKQTINSATWKCSVWELCSTYSNRASRDGLYENGKNCAFCYLGMSSLRTLLHLFEQSVPWRSVWQGKALCRELESVAAWLTLWKVSRIQWPRFNWTRQGEGRLSSSPRQHLCRLVKACLPFLCTEHTKIVAHAKDLMSTFQ